MRTEWKLYAEIRALKIFYFTTIMGVVVMAGIVTIISNVGAKDEGSLKEYSDIILGITAALAVILFLVARKVFSRKMMFIRNSSVNIKEKLNYYRTALILYVGLCEFPALLALVLYLTTFEVGFLVIGAGMLIAMIMKFPSRKRVISDMDLDWKDQQEISGDI